MATAAEEEIDEDKDVEHEDEHSLDASHDSESESQQSSAHKDDEVTTTSDVTQVRAADEESHDESIESARLLKQTLDGFLLILSNDGDITYVTDNISDYLGISKVSSYEIIHWQILFSIGFTFLLTDRYVGPANMGICPSM